MESLCVAAKHAAGLLGVVTRAANACPCTVDDGHGGTRKVLRRDAVRVSFPPRLAGQKRASSAFAAPPPPAAVSETGWGEAHDVQETPFKRARSKAPCGPVTPCLVPARRAALKEGAAKHEQEQQLGLQHMLASRGVSLPTERAAEHTATSRLAAVRERVLARLAAHGQGSE